MLKWEICDVHIQKLLLAQVVLWYWHQRHVNIGNIWTSGFIAPQFNWISSSGKMKDIFINAGNNYCSLHKVNSYFLVESSITVLPQSTIMQWKPCRSAFKWSTLFLCHRREKNGIIFQHTIFFSYLNDNIRILPGTGSTQ